MDMQYNWLLFKKNPLINNEYIEINEYNTFILLQKINTEIDINFKECIVNRNQYKRNVKNLFFYETNKELFNKIIRIDNYYTISSEQ